MEKLRCVVERITYHNEQNGYTVIRCRARGVGDLVTVVGLMPEIHVGSVLQIEGNWKVDAKYGRQFSLERFEETLPATVYGIEKYLGSGLIRGIGPKFARRIVQTFGKDTLEVIETDPDSLLRVPGIGRQRVEQVKKSWSEQKEIKNIMLFLQGHDVSTSHATKIFKTYGSESIAVVQENPYRLADDIWGIGFKTADTIAEKMGFGHERYARLRSGLLYTLNRLADEGHCYATRGMLMQKGTELLGVEDNVLSLTLDEMVRARDVITQPVIPENGDGLFPANVLSGADHAVNGFSGTNHSGTDHFTTDHSGTDYSAIDHSETDHYGINQSGINDSGITNNKEERDREKRDIQEAPERAIYLPPFFFAETGVVRRLRAVWQNTEGIRVVQEGLAAKVAARTRMQYDEVQIQAILTAVRSKVMILTGGPGTGKTTTTLGIITAFRAAGARILLAAPTGRAAKRLSETTGMEAKTIHRLLEVKPPEGYQKNEENPLKGDVLIVDECSMIDLLLFYNLLKAVPDSMTLVLVGDVDQLPSVGAGNVLRDMIDAGCFPVVRLTRIFRQAQASRIITNAHRINAGRMPDISNGRQSDFFFTDMELQAARMNRAREMAAAGGNRGLPASDQKEQKKQQTQQNILSQKTAGQERGDRSAGSRRKSGGIDPAQAALRTIVDLVCHKLPRYYQIPPSEIQVLTPMQRGIVGAENLNQELQRVLNPENAGPNGTRGKAAGLRRGGFSFRARDKVMQIRNNYEKEVFNGDIGIVLFVDMEERCLTVRFDDRDISYDVSELDELVLAYAATIHKAQGSEYPLVVMPVLMNHYIMLQRNLIYTGITRAKKVLVLAGTKKALAYAVHNVTVTKRSTMLRQRLLQALGGLSPAQGQALRAASYADRIRLTGPETGRTQG